MGTVHQLKATIVGIRPQVWRRVVVPSSMSLAGLHDVLQAAFGWWGYHLHEFEIGRVRYGVDDGEDWQPPQNERHARLSEVAPVGMTFVYTYDFGDNWRCPSRTTGKPEPSCHRTPSPRCTTAAWYTRGREAA